MMTEKLVRGVRGAGWSLLLAAGLGGVGGCTPAVEAEEQLQAGEVSQAVTPATREVLPAQFLQDIAQALPERQSVPQRQPGFIAPSHDPNVLVSAVSDVWVTFVSEGASKLNTFGYFTYPEGSPPTSAAQVSRVVIFANASAQGSGGTLVAGERIYLGRFNANTRIGFFLVVDGWTGTGVDLSRTTYYSADALNPETDPTRRRHVASLYHAGEKRRVLGFEDLNRQSGSDDDFNDVVFTLSSNPVGGTACGGPTLPVACNSDTDCTSGSACSDIGTQRFPGRSCMDILQNAGSRGDGLYWIRPGTAPAMQVWCDMTTDGGGWTLVARTRAAGLTTGERQIIQRGFWQDYSQLGYGSPAPTSSLYWMPLEQWHALTSNALGSVLRQRTDTEATAVRVKDFKVGDASQKHAWQWSPEVGYRSIPADLNGARFTARDQDNDTWGANCSVDNVGYNGGFWYTNCWQFSMLHSNGNLYRLDVNPTEAGSTVVGLSELYVRDTPCTPASPVAKACTLNPTCTDGVRNGTETGVDCGGSCGPCAAGSACNSSTDCTTGTCCQPIGSQRNPGTSCMDILQKGGSQASGLYWLKPGSAPAFQAWCDMTNEGGGWMLAARTQAVGLTSEERNAIHYGTWAHYTQSGYGSPHSTARIYWLPLEQWSAFTSGSASHQLRQATDTSPTAVQVRQFRVLDATQLYAWQWLTDPGYRSIPSGLNGAHFTTHDRDNDTWYANCAKDNVGYNGGFWYTNCWQFSMLHSNGNVYRLDVNPTEPGSTTLGLGELYLRCESCRSPPQPAACVP